VRVCLKQRTGYGELDGAGPSMQRTEETENREQRTEEREQRTENRERLKKR
jgi:hypothetical protein